MTEARDQGTGPGGPGGQDPPTDGGDGRGFYATPTHVGAAAGLDKQEASADPALEANIILIAHPENRDLGRRFRLSPGSTLELGRVPEADVCLADNLSVSRRHARLNYGPEGVVLEDLGSKNGTFLNDRLVDAPTLLKSGDRFQVGTVHFKFLRQLDVEHAYHETIHHLVSRDGLTGAYNRRRYEEEAHREVARAGRYGRPLSLILFDLDEFKEINDRHGHLCGDAVLKQVVELASGFLRPEQVLARVGGEEFAILSPEVDIDRALILAEKLCRAIAQHEFACGSRRLQLTASFGVSALKRSITSAHRLYEAADRALYIAKQGGRNRVATPPAVV